MFIHQHNKISHFNPKGQLHFQESELTNLPYVLQIRSCNVIFQISKITLKNNPKSKKDRIFTFNNNNNHT